jgi:hypothetical protein
MSFEVDGTLLKVSEVSTVGGITKRSFVVEVVSGKYTDKLAFDVLGEKCDDLEGALIGKRMKVKFNIKSKEYNGKWYTSLNAWSVYGDAIVSGKNGGKKIDNGGSVDNGKDDLPF